MYQGDISILIHEIEPLSPW